MMSTGQPIDINPTHLETIQRILDEHVPDYEVRAFGSRAKWNAEDYSDLDLAVVGDQPLDWRILSQLEMDFEESDLPFRVDVLDWHDISDKFRELIEANCIALVEANRHDDRTETTVGEFAPFSYGKALKKDKRNSAGSVPVYGSNGIVGWHDEAVTQGPTVVVGRKGTVGAVHYSPVPCWPIDTTFFVTGQDPELVRFQYYALKSLKLDSMDSDSAVPGLNREAAHARPIRIPSSTKQRFVANILGTLDDKIELNQRMNETLEAMAQALFKSWFIDFDPVRAKMEGRWRPGESLPGLPAHLYDLFPDRLTPSDLGDIPESWHINSLDEIAVFKNGLALQKYRPTRRDKRLPVVKISQLRNGIADSREWATASIGSEHIINDGDIIFSWSGSLMVRIWCGGEAALNQHLFKVISNRYPRWLVWHLLNSHLLNFKIIASGKATTLGHIKRHHLQEAICVVPNNVALTVADELQSIIFNRIVRAKVQVRRLEALRKNLLINLDQLL